MRPRYSHPALLLLMCGRWDDAFGDLLTVSHEALGEARFQANAGCREGPQGGAAGDPRRHRGAIPHRHAVGRRAGVGLGNADVRSACRRWSASFVSSAVPTACREILDRAVGTAK
jgi:hypothetical protein